MDRSHNDSPRSIRWILLIQIVVGLLVAVALILPGISVTHMLYLFGLYEPVLNHIYHREFVPLLPLAVGVILGIFLVSRLIEKLLERYTTNVYLAILGFVAVSVWSLLPKELGRYPVANVILFVVGFIFAYQISKREVKDCNS